jgi:hypothetical protein
MRIRRQISVASKIKSHLEKGGFRRIYKAVIQS